MTVLSSTVNDSEPERLRYLESIQESLFPETPTPPKAQEPDPSSVGSYNFEDCQITGFPRFVELTAPDGTVHYHTFDMLRPRMDAKVSGIVHD